MSVVIVLNSSLDNSLIKPLLSQFKAQFKEPEQRSGQYLDNIFNALCHIPPYPYAAFDSLQLTTPAQYPYWLKATPVHIQTSHNDAYITQYHDLNLDTLQAQQLIAELQELIMPSQGVFHAIDPQCWLLNLADVPNISMIPVHKAYQHSLLSLLPQSMAARTWQQLTTEIQMLFYKSPVNTQRQQLQQLAINSLWFWGEGTLPSQLSLPYQRIISDDVRILRYCYTLNFPHDKITAVAADGILNVSDAINHNGNDLLIVLRQPTETLITVLATLQRRNIACDLYLNDQVFKSAPRQWWRWWC